MKVHVCRDLFSHSDTWTTDATIDGTRYEVSSPLNDWDMNYHFWMTMPDGTWVDYLVDMDDVAEWDRKDTSSLASAIEFVKNEGIEMAAWKRNTKAE